MSNHNSDHRANSDVNSAAECRLSKSWLVASLLSRVSGVWCLVSTVTHGGRGCGCGLACGGAWLLLAGVQMAQGGRAGGDWQWQNPESRAPDSGCEVDGIDKVHRARCTLRGRSERAAFPGPLALQPSGHGDSPLGSLDSTPSGEEERHGPPPMRNRSHSHSQCQSQRRTVTRSPVTPAAESLLHFPSCRGG